MLNSDTVLLPQIDMLIRNMCLKKFYDKYLYGNKTLVVNEG